MHLPVEPRALSKDGDSQIRALRQEDSVPKTFSLRWFSLPQTTTPRGLVLIASIERVDTVLFAGGGGRVCG